MIKGTGGINYDNFVILKILFIYLFIFGCIGSSLLYTGFLQLWQAGATLRCSAQTSHCGLQAHVLQQLWSMCSVVVACELQSAGSLGVTQGFICSMACGIFPDQGLNPCPCIGRWILKHCATREVHDNFAIIR